MTAAFEAEISKQRVAMSSGQVHQIGLLDQEYHRPTLQVWRDTPSRFQRDPPYSCYQRRS